MKKMILVLVLFLLSMSTLIFSLEIDNQYIKKFKTDFTLQIIFDHPQLKFTIHPENENVDDLEFRPNTYGRLGGGIGYKNLGGSYTMNLFRQDDNKYGKSDYFDIQFYYFKRRFGIDLFYQDYKGFYLKKDNSIYSDFKLKNIGMNAYFVFNYKQFSMPAAFKQSEKQINDAGSFLAFVSFVYQGLDTGKSLVPFGMQSSFPNDVNDLREGNFYTLSIGPGYAHTFLFTEDLTFTFLVHIGAGIQYQNYQTTTKDKTDFKLPLKGSIKLSLLYNIEHFFTGLNFHADFNNVSFVETEFNIITIMIKFFAGLRF